MSELKLFDIVALTEDLPDQQLFEGQVGTIVEVYQGGEAFDVEFVDQQGRTYGLVTLQPTQLMVLHYQPVQVAA